MTRLDWIDSFKTGFTDIDASHRDIAGRIDRLVERVRDGVTPHRLEPLCTEILRLVEAHFDVEHAVLSAAGFPTLTDHIARDKACLERLEPLLRLPPEETPESRLLFSDTMNDWFIRHILLTDSEIITFGARRNLI